MDYIRKFLQAPVFEDEEKTRLAELVNTILLSLILLVVVGFLSILFFSSNTPPLQYGALFAIIALALGLKFALGSGHVTAISIILVLAATVFIAVILISGGTIRAPAISVFILISLIAGLLLGRKAAFWSTILNIVIVSGLVYAEMSGYLPPADFQVNFQQMFIFGISAVMTMILLNQALRRIQASLELARQNEQKARVLADSLEQRVLERTAIMEQTNLYLALATEVGQNVAQVRELNSMLRDAAEIIRAFFGMYYVQVYLVNPAQTELQLQFGTGSVGAELLSRWHHLPLDENSINGRAAVTKRSVVIADTLKSAIFRPNPLLPNTRSEMAVPLLVGDQLIGVLDMQSEQPNALNESALIAFEPLSGQLAIAIQNSRLIAETQQARKELEALTNRLTRAGWDEYLDAIHRPEMTGFVYEENRVVPLTEVKANSVGRTPAITAEVAVGDKVLGSLVVETDKPVQNTRSAELLQNVARQVAQQVENLRLLDSADRYRTEAEQALRRLTREGWQTAQEASVEPGYLYKNYEVQPISQFAEQMEDFQVFPLTVRNEAIGEIAIAGKEKLSPDDEDLLSTVIQQLSTHLEGLRLTRQTELALVETEELYAASARIVRATTMEDVLRTVVESSALKQFNHATIMIFDEAWANEPPEAGRVVAQWVRPGQSIPSWVGKAFPIGRAAFLASVRQTPLVVANAETDPRFEPEMWQLMHSIGKSLTIFPLVVGDQWFGLLSAIGSEATSLSADDMRQIQSLVSQAAAIVQSVRLYEQTQASLAQTEMLYEIGRLLNNANNVDEILDAVSLPAREQGCREASLIYFDLDESNRPNAMMVMAVWSNDGRETLPVGAHLPLADSPFAPLLASGSSTPHLVNDVLAAEHLPAVFKESMAASGNRAIAIIPLTQAGRWLGIVIFRWDDVHNFSQAESDTYGALIGLAAPAVQSRRLLIQAQSRAQREQALRQITSAVRASTDPATIMRTAVREIGTILGRKALIRIDRPDQPAQAEGAPAEKSNPPGTEAAVQDLGAM